MLLLATDETADDQRKETLVSALRALDSALKVNPSYMKFMEKKDRWKLLMCSPICYDEIHDS